MKVNYNEVKDYIMNKLNKNKIAVLATAGKDNRVTARNMSIINNDLDIYFQTDKKYLKVQQITENPKVALCFENIQIEALAENCGHSSLEQNRWFCDTYKQIHPGSFRMYTMLPDQLIFKLKPILITCWIYKDKTVYRDFLDCLNQKAEREIYMYDTDD